MSEQNVSCPHCEGLVLNDGSLSGEVVECPGCQGTFTMPPLKSQSPRKQPPRKQCIYCGENVQVQARKCRYCGETLDPALRAAEEAKFAVQQQQQQQHSPFVINNNLNANANATVTDSGSGYGGNRGDKSRTTAAILAVFLGGIGGHKFYLGQGFQGLFYLLFCWTFIPAIVAFIEGLSFFGMSDKRFWRKYG